MFDEKPYKQRTSSSDSARSDFSLWSESGDLVDQLAAEQDPLHSEGSNSFELEDLGRSGRPGSRRRRSKHVSYEDHQESSCKEEHAGAVKRKEDISIPSPPPRKIARAERILAFIMSPGDGPSRLHGLHGKKLM